MDSEPGRTRGGRDRRRGGRAAHRLALESLESRLPLAGDLVAIGPSSSSSPFEFESGLDPSAPLDVSSLPGPTATAWAIRPSAVEAVAWEVGYSWSHWDGAPPPLHAGAVTMAEPAWPHPTPESAFGLPAAGSVAIVGHLGLSEAVDVYKIPPETIDGELSLTIRRQLVPGSPEARAGLRVWLLDAAGRPLGRWPLLPQFAGLVLRMRSRRGPMAGPLYLGIGRIGGSGVPAMALSYELVMTRGGASPSPMPSGSGGGTADGPGGTVVADPGPAGLPGSTAVGRGSPVVATVADRGPAPEPPIGGRIAVPGPAPLREAAPAGGRLATGDPVEPVDPAAGALIDLALIDLESADPATAVAASVAPLGGPPAAVVEPGAPRLGAGLPTADRIAEIEAAPIATGSSAAGPGPEPALDAPAADPPAPAPADRRSALLLLGTILVALLRPTLGPAGPGPGPPRRLAARFNHRLRVLDP